jgi:hypothetical protein
MSNKIIAKGIKINVTSTGRYHMREMPHIFDEKEKHFPSMKEAKKWIRDTYGKSRGKPIYRDIGDKPVQVGYIFGFWNSDVSHYPVNKWFQQDWIEINKIILKTPDLK